MVCSPKRGSPVGWTLLAGLAAAALPAVGAAVPTISGYAATNPRGVAIFSAPPGAPLLIEGANLGTGGTVAFNGLPAPAATSWSPTEIEVTVPAASSYPFQGPVTVTTNGQTASGPDFTITPPPPSPPPPSLGTWSVIAAPRPSALSVDTTGNLYVAEHPYNTGPLILKRDAQGKWSLIAGEGTAPGQVTGPTALAVDPAGNLYVADPNFYDSAWHSRIQKRNAQGHWSVLDLGQVTDPTALAADGTGNLYVVDGMSGSISKWDVQGGWSVLATPGSALGEVTYPTAVAADTAGNLYVAEQYCDVCGFPVGVRRIQKRDAQGNWSVLDTNHSGLLAADAAGNLYVVGDGVQKRDVQGNWSVLDDADPDQVFYPIGLAVDAAGNLYVADTDNNRVLKYTPAPGP